MTNKEFVARLLDVAKNHKTIYMMGTFGAPVTEGLIAQKVKQYPNYYSPGRQNLLKGKISDGPWAFDCVGLIKGILWGWIADRSKSFGGAKYRSNDVPDISANTMASRCLERKDTLESILPGEAVYLKGHIGIYVGDGKVVESTLTGKYDGVVVTDLQYRKWLGHGKLPWITYESEISSDPQDPGAAGQPGPSISGGTEKPGSEVPAVPGGTEKPTTSLSPEETKTPPQVGDLVTFLGGKHYVSSNGSLGYKAKPGPARVTRYLPGRKHPYHLIHTDKTSNVYGWVNQDTVSK